MKMYFICEEDVADHSDIVHAWYLDLRKAEEALSGWNDNNEISFYIMQADVKLYVVPYMPTSK